MAGAELITKRVAISKANAQMVAIVGVASFVTIFCLMASKAVLSQNSYQSRVIKAQKAASSQLQANLTGYNALSQQYKSFIAAPTNVLGGQTSGSGDKSGNNAKLVLDALPPTYDFPALASSIESILTSQNLSVSGIGGTDAELTEQTNNSSPSPTPVIMPFNFSVNDVNYQNVGSLFTNLQQSIRPISVDSFTLSGGGQQMNLSVAAHTYYQPAKTLSITQQEVK